MSVLKMLIMKLEDASVLYERTLEQFPASGSILRCCEE